MANIQIPENLQFNTEVRAFETEDDAHADLFNRVVAALLENEMYLKRIIGSAPAGIATGVCTEAASTTKKTVDCPDFVLRDGARVMVTFNNGNTSNYMTLNVNGTGAYFAWFPLGDSRVYNDDAISKLIAAGCAYEFIFQEKGTDSKWVYCGVVSTAESLGVLSKDDLSNRLGGPGIPVIQAATDSGGLMEIGKYIDFHDAGSQADFDARLYYDQGKLVSTVPVKAGLDGNAVTASCAATIGNAGNANSTHMTFNWSGQPGQPPWVWGGTDGASMYVYNPGNFNVNSAVKDGNGKAIADTYLPKTGGLVTGDVEYKRHVVCHDTGGLSLNHQNEFITLTNSASGYGGHTIFDGLICADNVDGGCVDYIARGGNLRDHYFISIDYNGKAAGTVNMGDGKVYAPNGFRTQYGDYAEHWEWEDANKAAEDRTGLFVAFTGNQIRIAQKGDALVKVGVVSASPSILGDSDGKEWVHKYQKDVYGRFIREESGCLIINPEYDESKKYIKRADRPEWDAVGTHGKLVVRDDGTCQPDGFCVPTDGGIATAAEEGFYVMERLDESHIRIYMR